MRSQVDAVLTDYFARTGDGDERVFQATQAVERLRELGPDAVPHLARELAQDATESFDFFAYALSRFDTPESVAALQAAIARADEQSDEAARVRKAWAAWSLALIGRTEALTSLFRGDPRAALFQIHAGTSAIEAAAIQLAPQSVPLLVALLEKPDESADDWPLRLTSIRALRRLGDGAALPALVGALAHANPRIRAEAAMALGALDRPEASSALTSALGDPDPIVRRQAAAALREIAGVGVAPEVFARLESESDRDARAELYKLLAVHGGDRGFARLLDGLRQSDADERTQSVRALGLSQDPRRIDTLAQALSDRATAVALEAATALGAIDDRRATDALIRSLSSVDGIAVHGVTEQLLRNSVDSAAPAMTERLLRELSQPVGDPRGVFALQRMMQTLVRWRHLPAIDPLRAAIEHLGDPRLKAEAERTTALLTALERNGDRARSWIATLDSPDRDLRLLAYAELSRIGSRPAVAALVARFEAAPRDEQFEIVRALLSRRPQAQQLIDRLLTDPRYDAPGGIALREMAAWSARRIGGEQMRQSLQHSVARREGQDARVLVYLALLAGDDALPLLDTYRKARMRYIGWQRGREQEKLDWIARRLRSGATIEAVDVEPAQLAF